MSDKGKKILIHVLGSLSFLAMPIIFSPQFPNISSIFSAGHFYQELLSSVLILSFFFLNYYVLIPKLFRQKKRLIYTLVIIASFAFVVFIPQLLIKRNHFRAFKHKAHQMEAIKIDAIKVDGVKVDEMKGVPVKGGRVFVKRFHFWHLFLYRQSFPFFIALAFGAFLSADQRLKKVQKARTEAELNYLKSQMNPHFLFNTLNSIYALALEKSDDTATAVVQLSGMMRYILTDAQQAFVPLSQEMAYINAYIELQKLRLVNENVLSIEVEGEVDNRSVAPLMLIPFIENAFKHGISTDENCKISIRLKFLPKRIQMEVVNAIVEKMGEEETSGIGIENTRMRLEMLYPGRHTLKVTENEKEFRVWLDLQQA